MRLSLVSLSCLAAVGYASPLTHPTFTHLYSRQNATNTTNPCAAASAAIAAGTTPAPIGEQTAPKIPAKIAYECLNDIPLNTTAALALIDAMKPYLGWQSTTSYLKDPPAQYAQKIQPAVDIYGGLDNITAQLHAGTFKSEYEFGWSLYTLIQSAHDGHLTYIPDSIGGIFQFGRPAPLVSISEDGKKLPAIFAYSDVIQQSFGNATWTPAAVVKINGEEVIKYLEDFSQYGSLQDRDALFNNLFYELPQIALGVSGTGTGVFSGGGRGRYVYPGAETVLEFDNGTTRTYENYAINQISFRSIRSGEDIAKTYFVYRSSATPKEVSQATEETAAAAATSSAGSAPPGYPPAVTKQIANLIGGYYLDGDDYADVAVLSVPSFVSDETAEQDFQSVGKKFLAQAKADGKKRLIIDLSANGGGTILQGYDLFKQLFPSILPYGANRFRAHEAVDLIGQRFSKTVGSTSRTLDANYTLLEIMTTPFDYHNDVTENYTNFNSWQEKYGPHEYNGDNFTTLSRWNLSDSLITLDSGGIQITGYGNLSNYTTQPFEAQNIVMVFDGYCASTCTLFAEMMRKQAGVRAIAMGGRPTTAAIQAVGGTKGANNYEWGFIQELAAWAVSFATDATEKARLMASEVGKLLNNIPFDRAATSPNLNVRDQIRKGDATQTPLQFQYELADCRIFYTASMTVDITQMWKAAADSTWGTNSRCVEATVGGYSGQSKRDTSKALTVPRQVGRRAVDMRQKLEQSLELETDLKRSKVKGDGFMLP